ARRSRGHGNRAALTFQWAIFAAREGWVAATQTRLRLQGRQGPKGPKGANANLWYPESIGGDNAYTGGRKPGETADIPGCDLRRGPAKHAGRCCARQNRVSARAWIDCVKI